MLTKDQASDIVRMSIQKDKNLNLVPGSSTLETLGFTSDDELRILAITIVSDPIVGVPRLQHYLDANNLADLTLSTTVDSLDTKVMELSAGKLCSNPTSPHPQVCCPYPTTCAQCGYPVR